MYQEKVCDRRALLNRLSGLIYSAVEIRTPLKGSTPSYLGLDPQATSYKYIEKGVRKEL